LLKSARLRPSENCFFKLNQTKKDLETLSRKNPEFSEIATSLGVKDTEVAEMDLRMGSRDVSLNEIINDESSNSHIDFLAYEGDDQEVSLIKNEEKSLVQRG